MKEQSDMHYRNKMMKMKKFIYKTAANIDWDFSFAFTWPSKYCLQ